MHALARVAMATALITLAPLATAETLPEAADRVCEKIKQCTLSQIDQADMTPEMREMMMPMVNSLCDAMREGINEVPTGHELYPPALACMQSMAELSCADFQDAEKSQTAACQAYREKVEATYGQQTGQ